VRIETVPLVLVQVHLLENPFACIDIKNVVGRLDEFEPISRFYSESMRDNVEDRLVEYDAGRVRYFRDRYRTKQHVSAVHLKSCTDGLRVYNGYHRLCGAILAGVTHLRVIIHLSGDDKKGASRHADVFRRAARSLLKEK
jgi:hypothetical protein